VPAGRAGHSSGAVCQQLRRESASTLAFQLLKIGRLAKFVKALKLKYELNALTFWECLHGQSRRILNAKNRSSLSEIPAAKLAASKGTPPPLPNSTVPAS